MTKETNKSRPTHRVYAVAKNGEKKFWQPIGAMWAHADSKGFIPVGKASGRMGATRPTEENNLLIEPSVGA